MAGKKYCVRCSHEMWYDETKKRWYCTNPKCVKYKEPPQEVVEAMQADTEDE